MSSSNSSPTILLVDDDAAFTSGFSDRLKDAGFDVITLPDDRRVIETLVNQSPAFVILDWDLGPKASQHGAELYVEIAAARPVPVLKISNYTNHKTCLADNQLALETGRDYRHVDKLLGVDRIIDIIQFRLANQAWPPSLLDPNQYT